MKQFTNMISNFTSRTLAVKRTCFVAILSLAFCTGALAQKQMAARPDRGMVSGNSYSVSDIESLSLNNGNLNLSIPLASLPPIAGGKLSWTVNATYNSKLWNVIRRQEDSTTDTEWHPYTVDVPAQGSGGWRIGGGYEIEIRNARYDDFWWKVPEPEQMDSVERARLEQSWFKVVLHTPDGAERELRPTNGGFAYTGTQDFLRGYFNLLPNGSNPYKYHSFDGTYLAAVIKSSLDWTLFMTDGTQVIQTPDGIQRIRDTNGNSIKIFTDANGTHYQDEQTLREIRVTESQVWYQTVGGTWVAINLNWGTTTVQGKIYEVNDWSQAGGEGGVGSVCTKNELLQAVDIPALRSIVFPQTEPNTPGRSFAFSYNSDTSHQVTYSTYRPDCSPASAPLTVLASDGWGSLSRMVTPGGSQVDYSYNLTSEFAMPLTDADEITKETIVEKKLSFNKDANGNYLDTASWSYGIGSGVGSVSNPDGTSTEERFYTHSPGMAYSAGKAGLVYRSTSYGVRIDRHWTEMPFSGAQIDSPAGAVSFNPVVDAEYTTLTDAQGNAVKMSAKTYLRDYNGNVTEVKEYDWLDLAQVDRDSLGVPTGVPAGSVLLRTTDTSYYHSPTFAISTDVYARRDLAASPIGNAAKETSIGTSRTQIYYDGQPFGVAPTKGNVTAVGSFDDRGDANASNDRWITAASSYDTYGNRSTATDANDNVTQFFYEDATHALPTRVVVDPLNGTGQQTTTTVYDFSTGLMTRQTDANGQVSDIDYTNQLLNTVDPFGRPGVMMGPTVLIDNVSQRRKAFTFYEDAARRVRVESDLNAEGDRLLKSRETRDELGRTVLMEQSENGSTYTISSRNVYLDMGRIILSSNPRRSGGGSSPDGWTRATKDLAGRVVEVATFFGSLQPPPTGTNSNRTGSVTTNYSANEVTVIDQQNKTRKSVTDALGRLLQVVEDPGGLNYVTGYTYDTHGNLRKVNQGGQLRYFMYDSLSRLVRARNPEQNVNATLALQDTFKAPEDAAPNAQWTMSYSYDLNGNLSSKVDARDITSTYAYDGFNRNITIDYSDTTDINPDIKRDYDGAASGKGRFWKEFKGGNETVGAQVEFNSVEAYDEVGRPLRKHQKFKTGGLWSEIYEVKRSYFLTGSVRTQTYPSGHTVHYTQDDAGRINGFTGNLGDGATRSYATGLSYDAAGRMTGEQFGTQTAVYHRRRYNSRGQLNDVRLSTDATNEWAWNRGAIVAYYDSGYHWSNTGQLDSGPDNNGNVMRAQHWVPGDDAISTFSLSSDHYSYDSLNRITSMTEYREGTGAPPSQTFTQAFTYDRWGNRTINQSGTTQTLPSDMRKDFIVDAQTNRLGVPSGHPANVLMTYDDAGNLATDTYTGTGARTYDAENRVTSAQGPGIAAGTFTNVYTYDAAGRRTRRKTERGEVWQVYGFDSELIAEYASRAAHTAPEKEYGYRNGELLISALGGSSGNSGATMATFVKMDASTQGTWKGAYGNDGYYVVADGASYPAYAQVSFTGHTTHTWAATTTDVRALQKSASGSTERVAAAWYSASNYTIDLNLTDGQTHQVALYCLDWDYNNTRAQRVEVIDAASNAVLDSRDVTAFTGGQYAVWNLRGHVKLKVIYTGPVGLNATVSGIFFDDARVNVAASSQGATATASSLYSYGTFTAASTINGDRRGLNWGAGGGWNDGTPDVYPDWLQVDFSGAKTINEVNVFTCQDNHAAPSEPTEAMIFSLYGLKGYQVEYWTGSAWVSVGSVSGNDKVWSKVNFPAVTTTKIRVLTNDALASYSRITEVEAYQAAPPTNSVNVAAASGGATATASSVYQYGSHGPEGTINGDRKGANWGAGGGWNDGTQDIYPDWLQVDFNGRKTISEIDVFTVQDNHAAPSEPTLSQTFTLYGLTAYEVQYWTGTAWAGVPNASVVGNDKVWRKFTFPALTTEKIRLVTSIGLGSHSRVTEVEAWSATQAAASGAVQWLVTDHLGTPRMIADLSGSLAGIKRHDYLPFGEELGAGVGGRTTNQGYVGDSVRQKYAGTERDAETGLDYMRARYYSSLQGRFTSVDPGNAGAYDGNPQTWNGYSYALNNPLLYSDPDGLKVRVCGTDGNCADLSDKDARNGLFNKQYQKSIGGVVKNGKIYLNGELVGTYQRTSFDDLDDRANAVIFGNRNSAGLVERAPVAGKTALTLYGRSAAVGLSIGSGGTNLLLNSILGPLLIVDPHDSSDPLIAGSIENDRRAAVREAWRLEAEKVRTTGRGTQQWTPDELRQLRDTGKVSGYEGHHINSVAGSPQSARDPNNIKFVKGRAAHLTEHGGNFRNRTTGPLIRRR